MEEKNIIDKIVKEMRSRGAMQMTIDNIIEKVKNTCVACKYRKECCNRGKVKHPFQTKCIKHEYVNELFF